MSAAPQTSARRVGDAICALGILSWVFWPLAIVALGLWFFLWVARSALVALLVIATVGAFVAGGTRRLLTHT